MANSYMNSSNNIQFSQLRGQDLLDLLVYIENTFLEYRDLLYLPKDITFGTEIEYEGCLRSKTDSFVDKHLNDWDSKSDGSLHSGGEVVSLVMTDEIKYWNELKEICLNLTKRKADTSHNAGGHVHIGAAALNDDVESWRLFLKLYAAYENTLFRFIYGDKINGREKLFYYAKPVARAIYNKLDLLNRADCVHDFAYILSNYDRYVALNLNNVDFWNSGRTYGKNTIEFRGPNATTNHVIWQNNINTFSKMILSSREKTMDEDFLNYKLSTDFKPYEGNEFMYNDVCLKNALQFVDLVFDNNLDKIYFLRQYLKGFQENYGLKKTVKAKKFVK